MIHQPMTTDCTPAGLKRARNQMRIRLWDGSLDAHRWLCHPERECKDGCNDEPLPGKVELYQSELEK